MDETDEMLTKIIGDNKELQQYAADYAKQLEQKITAHYQK